MLYFCQMERRDFGDLTSTENLSRLAFETSPKLDGVLTQAPRGQTVLAVWSQKPQDRGQLPDLLVCPDGTDEDWAAWITTFATKIRPFSAHMRLATYTGLKRTLRELRAPTLSGLTWPVAGLVLGEVLAASRLPDKTLETVPAAACASTLSFAMFRAAATYSNFQQWAQLVYAWESVRQVTKQRARAIDGTSVARICLTIVEAAGLDGGGESALSTLGDRELRIACHELISSPELFPLSLVSLVGDFELSLIDRIARGSREDRVVAFAHFVRNTSTGEATNSEITPFILGYLASRIAPGTIRHSRVLMPIVDRYPTSLLWYGFCAGLGGSEGGSIFHPGALRVNIDLPPSARRVVRDLLRPEPLIGPPQYDISFLELMALSRTGREPLDGLVTTTQGTAIVELAQGVWTAINSTSKATLGEGAAQTLRDREIRATIGECIERLRKAYAELGGDEPLGVSSEQHSLFPTKRKRDSGQLGSGSRRK